MEQFTLTPLELHVLATLYNAYIWKHPCPDEATRIHQEVIAEKVAKFAARIDAMPTGTVVTLTAIQKASNHER